MSSILEEIKQFKDHSDYYSSGGCFLFYQILKSINPNAKPYYNGDHVITEIEGQFYDVNGLVDKDNHLLMSESEQIDALKWIPNTKINNMAFNKQSIDALAGFLNITAEDLTAKITSENEETLELPSGQFFSDEQLTQRVQTEKQSAYEEGKVVGTEKLSKSLHDKYSLSSDVKVKDIDGVVKAIIDKHTNDDAVSTLKKDMEQLNTNHLTALTEKENEIQSLNNSIFSQSVNNSVITSLKDEYVIGKDDMARLFSSTHQFEKNEDGKVVIKKDGEVLKHEKTLAPLGVEQVISNWAINNNYIKQEQGRGGSNGFSGSTKNLSMEEAAIELERRGVAQGTTEYLQEYTKLREE